MLLPEPATVSDLVNHIKDVLEGEFHEVMVQGEVTNLSPSSAGHWYFTLSDENACISCALFKMDAMRNPLIRTLKNGDKIVILGPLSVYPKRGSFQILAKRIMPAGEGQLKLQFERLKAKLAQEGLFDLETKKTIPVFPKRIAVITAPHGAALQDFLNVMKRRTLWHDIVIVPAVVQGADSPRSLVQALKKAQAIPDVDVIVLTRGGGSLEDLWSFNDEQLVRAIHECPIPTVSAVGHQVDFTLCDYVSDHRSETPTAAAETLSQPQTELEKRLTFCQSHLRSELFKRKQAVELWIQRLHPREILGLIHERLKNAHKELSEIRLRDRAHELIGFHDRSQELDELIMRMRHRMEVKVSDIKGEMKRLEQVMSALDPSKVLTRGYSYVETDKGNVLSTLDEFKKLPSDSVIGIHFQDGTGKVKKVTS
ncbi:MAG: exodeoxyribonuclease VII large subunit [Bacteriovoracaceae bacterium]